MVVKISQNQLKFFFQLIQCDKEFGGMIKTNRNGYIEDISKTLGGNYSVKYTNIDSSYNYSYHTHAYYSFLHGILNGKNVIDIIAKLIKVDMNAGLYLFECDIMYIHPPSPQDCYVCSHSNKRGMLIFTQEGIYEVRTSKILTLMDKDEIDNEYYRYIWGDSKHNVESCLQSNSIPRIIKRLRRCMSYRKRVNKLHCVSQYIRYLKTKGVSCKLVKWDTNKHVFFSRNN
tara:strand:+ start:200 stop:886 length:687 start_codon:yes stop_codon:yes gene_type:complete